MYDFELTDEEMEQIEALEKNEKHDWYVVYIGIRCYVKDWQEERGYY
mgnify:FL=1